MLPIVPKTEKTTKRHELAALPPPKPFNYCSKACVAEETTANSNRTDDDHETSISIEVIYRNTVPFHSCHHYYDCDTSFNVFDQSTNNCLNCSRCTVTCDDNISRTSNRHIGKGQTLLTSYFTVLKKKTPSTSSPDASFIYSKCDDAVEVTDERNNENWQTKSNSRVKIIRKYLHLDYRKNLNRQRLRQKLIKIIRKSKSLCAKRWHPYRRQPQILFTFLCLDAYQTYTNELMKMNGSNAVVGKRPLTNFGRSVSTATNKSTPIDVVAANKRVHKIVNDINGGPSSDEVNAKRLTKGNRTAENARMMLLYENQQETSEKDCSE